MGVPVVNPDVAQARRLAIDYSFIPPRKVQLDQFDLLDGNRTDKLCRKSDHSRIKITFNPSVV